MKIFYHKRFYYFFTNFEDKTHSVFHTMPTTFIITVGENEGEWK